MKFFRNIFHGSHVYSQSLMDSPQSYSKHSATQCAATCRTSLQYNQSWSCNSFLYSETTGLCRIAHNVDFLQDLFHQGYGDLYAGCYIDMGYRLYTLGSTTACLLFATYKQVCQTIVTYYFSFYFGTQCVHSGVKRKLESYSNFAINKVFWLRLVEKSNNCAKKKSKNLSYKKFINENVIKSVMNA